MKKKENKAVKIRRIHIVNYKIIDELEIEFPGPKMAGEPDAAVMGSRNGLGKTSVLECCVLLMTGLSLRMREIDFKYRRYMTVDLPEMIIRGGASAARLEGEIAVGQKTISLSMEIEKSGRIKVDSTPKNLLHSDRIDSQGKTELIQQFISIVSGMNQNPLLAENFLYFHSYRKVQEGKPELGMMVEDIDRYDSSHTRTPGYKVPMSTFKLHILRSMMSKAQLFEKGDDEQSEEILTKLNELVKRYAGGTIEKLRPSPDNTVDFRVQPVNGGPSFTFDGLSSGQKEIIATLFLVWYQTRKNPGVVLIDEPELHLNPEWHGDFIRQLGKIAPDNQYIIATHSEDVFASVDKDHRFLLRETAGEKS